MNDGWAVTFEGAVSWSLAVATRHDRQGRSLGGVCVEQTNPSEVEGSLSDIQL